MTHLLFRTGMIALLVTGCGFTSTSPGEAVVFSRFGAVDPTCYPAGFYLYNPLTTSVYHVDVKVQKFEVKADARSEEHTSELQSPCNLVCRLLLEKKKKNNSQTITSTI